MKTRIILVLVLVLAVGSGLLSRVNARREAARQQAELARQEAVRAAALAQARNRPSRTPAPTQAVHAPRGRKAELKDPEAREALRRVGTDPVANVVWALAINNPDLPAKEREDLIEDLNEEGFADPKNLTHADVPLIESRIMLIEQLAPQAMDEVNAAAFKEAHKDLVNMLARLNRQ